MSFFTYKALNLPNIEELSFVDPLKFAEVNQLIDGTLEGFQVAPDPIETVVPQDPNKPDGKHIRIGHLSAIIRHIDLPDDIRMLNDDIVSRVNFINSSQIFFDIALKIQGGKNQYLGLLRIKQVIIQEFLRKNLTRILADQEKERVNRLFLGV